MCHPLKPAAALKLCIYDANTAIVLCHNKTTFAMFISRIMHKTRKTITYKCEFIQIQRFLNGAWIMVSAYQIKKLCMLGLLFILKNRIHVLIYLFKN